MRPGLMVTLTAFLLAGCAGFEHDTSHTPNAGQQAEKTRLRGTMSCADCPSQPLVLSLYSSTRYAPERFSLAPLATDNRNASRNSSGDTAVSGTVFRIQGGRQYPDQQLLMLVAPVNQQIMLLQPLGKERYEVLRYQGNTLSRPTVFTSAMSTGSPNG